MRSFKLLAAAAMMAVMVAGPVMAQDAVEPAMDSTSAAAPAVSSEMKSAVKKHHAKKVAKRHAVKKHHAKKKAAEAAETVTTGQ